MPLKSLLGWCNQMQSCRREMLLSKPSQIKSQPVETKRLCNCLHSCQHFLALLLLEQISVHCIHLAIHIGIKLLNDLNYCVFRFSGQKSFIPLLDLQSSCPPVDEGCHPLSSPRHPRSVRAASPSARGCLGCYWRSPQHPEQQDNKRRVD